MMAASVRECYECTAEDTNHGFLSTKRWITAQRAGTAAPTVYTLVAKKSNDQG